jgi:hypothetical protein
MLRRHRFISLLLALALVGVASATTLAKGGVVTLDSALPSDPQPGSELIVGWTVSSPVDGGTAAPFSALGMFIRLIPPAGEPVEAVGAEDRPGHYIATIVVPEGGIRSVEFGLRGESCVNGACDRSDLMFGIAGEAAARAPVVVEAAPATQHPAVSGPSTSPQAATAPGPELWIVLALLGAVAVLAGVGATMARARRLEPGSTR